MTTNNMNTSTSTNMNAGGERVNGIPVHSTATLIKASIGATVIAAVVFVTAILPAEYNIDPTGIGQMSGLTSLAQAASVSAEPAISTDTISKISTGTVQKEETVIAFEQGATLANAPSVAEIAQMRQTPGVRSDTVKIDIPAGKGLEYKLLMDEFVHLEYEWSTGGEALYFDFHGEPKGDTTGYFESFSITTSDKMKGSLTTPFAGSHGWYWKNKTSSPITVTLSTKGDYTIKG
ncbi:conserved hypothetical protein [Shewanella sediminis HAW-EB3]|uniref:Transmembrane anchor protein n=1 Tax=Shewanella sediminis (strain HAW-EB3) TaxID=425104 RepID=A8FUL7_SHESH|nr:hypothetical protein [Shewanella sediminis]ABV36540.1 conserved hypothetical protein [Shewanella sediminis HAW-EB3]